MCWIGGCKEGGDWTGGCEEGGGGYWMRWIGGCKVGGGWTGGREEGGGGGWTCWIGSCGVKSGGLICCSLLSCLLKIDSTFANLASRFMGASSVATCRYNINQINFVNHEILVPIKKVNLWGTCAFVSTYIFMFWVWVLTTQCISIQVLLYFGCTLFVGKCNFSN